MLNEKSQQFLSPVLGRYHQLELVSGKGCYLYDVNQREYLDFSSGIAVTSTGHCHPQVVKAIEQQAKTLIHPCIAVGNSAPVIECAEKLTSLFLPHEFSVFFDQSGTTAVEAALKLAKYVSKKHKIVAFEGGFHGRSMGSLSVTTSKRAYQDHIGPMVEGVSFFPFPNMYRSVWQATDTQSALDCCLAQLQASELFNCDVAAVIIEPILGEGGFVPAPVEFLQQLQVICKANDILLIIDEIQTGIGRTGDWFLFQKYGLDPDIVVTAKGLGSGMPIGACLAKKELMNQWTAGAHGGTYGGNPVTCAAAAATLDVVEQYLPDINDKSQFCFDFLHTQLDDHPHVGDIRGAGLLIGLELVIDKTSKKPHAKLVKDVLDTALSRQLILISCGVYGNVIRILPPLVISKQELKQGLTILCEILNDYR